VERAAIFSGGDFGVGLFGVREGEFAGDGDDAAKFVIELGDAIEIDVGETFAGELSFFDPAGELRDGGVGDVFVFCGERAGNGGGADEAIFLRAIGLAGEDGGVVRERRDGIVDGDFARTGAALVESGHVGAPGGSGLGEIFGSELDLDEFFGFGEGAGGDFGADGGSGAEGGWSAGGAFGWVLRGRLRGESGSGCGGEKREG